MSRPITGPDSLIAGRYRLESQIGGGGMGAVWLARDELLGRRVAVKQVLSPLGADEEQVDEQRQRALREGRIAARLSHPHAISVYDVAVEGGAPWLVMEYLPSRSLAEVLAEDGVLRVDQVAQIGAQVADALAATHAAGIVHRDVKPGNVLIGRGGRVAGLVKITDFGISHASGDVTLTQTGQITGTPAYLAPEVAQGREMTEASDVFALGATLYTCLEGVPPFGVEDNALGMLHRVAGGHVTPPRRAGALTAPLLRMLAADPGARPSMSEVRDELATLAAGRDGDTTTVLLARTDLRPSAGPAGTAVLGASVGAAAAPPAAPPPTAPPPAPPAEAGPSAPSGPGPEPVRRRRAAWAAVAAVVALLVGALALWLGPLGDADPAPDRAVADPPSSAPTEAPPPREAPPETAAPETPSPEPEPVEPVPEEQPPDDGGDDGDGGDEDGEVDGADEEQPAADPLSASSIRDFLATYHQLVIADPARAWDLTGPTLRANINRDNYIAYWNQFSDVRLSDVRAADGQNTATATMELRYPGGRRETSPRVFTLLVRDGQLILDSDFAAR